MTTPQGLIAVVLCAHAGLALAGQVAECSWKNPGSNKFVGDKYAAVDSFSIPLEHRTVIKGQMKQREALGHDFPVRSVRFTKNRVVSDDGTSFNPVLTPMWFGRNTLCWHPSRDEWAWNESHYGDLFCSGTYCVAVPDVCGNVTQLFPGGKEFGPGQAVVERWASVPEPSTLSLIAAGVVVLIGMARRKR